MAQSEPTRCACGSKLYGACCGPFHQGAQVPESAEVLMRARYSAYVLGLMDFVHATWHVTTCPTRASLMHQPAVQWLGLEVRHHSSNGDQARVEFIARSKLNGRAQRLHEVSQFVREGGRWWYVDGEFPKQK